MVPVEFSRSIFFWDALLESNKIKQYACFVLSSKKVTVLCRLWQTVYLVLLGVAKAWEKLHLTFLQLLRFSME